MLSDTILPVNLEYDEPARMWWNTDYSSETAGVAEIDRLWDVNIPWESGIIALQNEEARAMGLPQSQPWPWDSKRKSIYIVNAHHMLHCVVRYLAPVQSRPMGTCADIALYPDYTEKPIHIHPTVPNQQNSNNLLSTYTALSGQFTYGNDVHGR